MNYISTRGIAPDLTFEDVILTGLATDGGLYVPELWPHFTTEEFADMADLDYPALAVRLLTPYLGLLGKRISAQDFEAIVHAAYAGFDHAEIAPLVALDGPADLHLLELFHGPTLAFKDFALQVLGRIMDRLLVAEGRRMTVVGATSGDTGSAAIAGCKGRENMRIFILHPKGRVSEVQRRQMTTVPDPNVVNIAIEGTFDDCQALVKAMFGDAGFRARQGLGAINSINWGRVMFQVPYYVKAYLALGRPAGLGFSVPTGNFGDVFAGYVAQRMGLPIRQLIVATNRNDILSRFFNDGDYSKDTVVPTVSPSMDIQVASNFERLLFDLTRHDGARVADMMATFDASGRLPADPALVEAAGHVFTGRKVDEDATLDTIRQVHRGIGMLTCPHTAVGIAAARTARRHTDLPMVCLATAHPAKFPDAVEKATQVRPGLPERYADLYDREERLTALPNDLGAIQTFIEETPWP